MASDGPALLALGAELVRVRRPVRAAGGVRRAGAVPAADAGDGLLAVLVLVDDVSKRLRLTGAVGGAGQGQGTSVQGWAPGHIRRVSGSGRRGRTLSPIWRFPAEPILALGRGPERRKLPGDVQPAAMLAGRRRLVLQAEDERV